MTREIRAFQFEMRAERDEKHGDHITGVPIVYEAKTDIAGWYEEKIAAGALDGADLRDVRFLVNHNASMIPLARSRNNNENSTMQMSVEEDGLHIRVDLDTEGNAEARSLYSAIRRGDISGMSFAFRVDSDSWEDLDTDYPKRTITGIGKVFEVSAVTWPAYDQTSLEARSNANALDSAASVLESARAEKRAAAERRSLAESILKKLEENRDV